jgi:hypothetical protein
MAAPRHLETLTTAKATPPTDGGTDKAFEAWRKEQTRRKARIQKICSTIGRPYLPARPADFLYDKTSHLLYCLQAKVNPFFNPMICIRLAPLLGSSTSSV